MRRPLSQYLPHPAQIVGIVQECDDTRTFILDPEPAYGALAAAAPGQFVMLSLWGHGEAALTLSTLPRLGTAPSAVAITVRCVGRVTTALFGLAEGSWVGLRGPFGRGFPLDAASVPTVYVAGGCGLSPLKAAIDWQLARRTDPTPMAIVYGAREPRSRIHRAALDEWRNTPAVTLIECVEHPDTSWRGRTGMLVAHIADAVGAAGARRAAVCGPPPMLGAAARRLRDVNVDPGQIFVAVERHMKCATGHCGHCYINQRYVCTDGPVFTFAELQELGPDAGLRFSPD